MSVSEHVSDLELRLEVAEEKCDRLAYELSQIKLAVSKPTELAKMINSKRFSGTTSEILCGLAKQNFVIELKSRVLEKRDECIAKMHAVEARIRLVLSLYDKIDPSKLTMESDFFKDLGLDSFDHVEIVMAMKAAFGFEIPDGDGDRLKTPRDIFRYMCNVIIQMHSQAVNSSNLINAQNAVCITLNNELEMRRNQYNTLARIQLRELLIHTSKMLHRGCRRSRFGRLYKMMDTDDIDLSKTAFVKTCCGMISQVNRYVHTVDFFSGIAIPGDCNPKEILTLKLVLRFLNLRAVQ